MNENDRRDLICRENFGLWAWLKETKAIKGSLLSTHFVQNVAWRRFADCLIMSRAVLDAKREGVLLTTW